MLHRLRILLLLLLALALPVQAQAAQAMALCGLPLGGVGGPTGAAAPAPWGPGAHPPRSGPAHAGHAGPVNAFAPAVEGADAAAQRPAAQDEAAHAGHAGHADTGSGPLADDHRCSACAACVNAQALAWGGLPLTLLAPRPAPPAEAPRLAWPDRVPPGLDRPPRRA